MGMESRVLCKELKSETLEVDTKRNFTNHFNLGGTLESPENLLNPCCGSEYVQMGLENLIFPSSWVILICCQG